MSNEQVRPLNYCAHAVEDLKLLAAQLHEQGAIYAAEALHGIGELLQRSVKFIMPNCCELIDPNQLGQSHLDLLRLPFPCVAFEAPWEKDSPGPQQVGDFTQAKSTKRIALCWDASWGPELILGMKSVLKAFPEGGVFMVPIFWVSESRRWWTALGGCFVPYENQATTFHPDDLPGPSRIAAQALIDDGRAKPKATQFRAEPFALLEEPFQFAIQQYGSREKAFAQLMLDSHDELMMLVQSCSVLNCANVTTSELAPAAALNKKRQAKGLQPFFTYKVLQLRREERASASVDVGQHASPRMHLRRGHLRRLNNKTTWVRPTTVNAQSKLGVVLKDYAVRDA